MFIILLGLIVLATLVPFIETAMKSRYEAKLQEQKYQ